MLKTFVVLLIITTNQDCQAKKDDSQPVKLLDILEEVTEMVADMFETVTSAMWEKKDQQQQNEDHEKNKWSITKVLKNVKYGYKTIVEFLPSFDVSREAFHELMPTFANSSIDEILQKYVY